MNWGWHWIHLSIRKDTREGLTGKNATLEKEATLIGALTAQDQKFMSCWVGDQSLDLEHKINITDWYTIALTHPTWMLMGPSAPEQQLRTTVAWSVMTTSKLSRLWIWDTLSSLLYFLDNSWADFGDWQHWCLCRGSEGYFVFLCGKFSCGSADCGRPTAMEAELHQLICWQKITLRKWKKTLGWRSPRMINMTGMTASVRSTSETTASSEGLTRTTVSRTSLLWRSVLCPAGEHLEHA